LLFALVMVLSSFLVFGVVAALQQQRYCAITAGPKRGVRIDWSRVAIVLIILLAASLMPVEKLPAASALTAFGLGLVSAVFDNIPLAALAPRAGELRLGWTGLCRGIRRLYDLVRLLGGCGHHGDHAEARSIGAWLRHGWHVALA
jgi:hypothetical protein